MYCHLYYKQEMNQEDQIIDNVKRNNHNRMYHANTGYEEMPKYTETLMVKEIHEMNLLIFTCLHFYKFNDNLG